MHALDMTTGKAGIAYAGETPWHGLGQRLTPGSPLEVWQQEAGLDWTAKQAGVRFTRTHVDFQNGLEVDTDQRAKDHKVLYRSDTGDVLSIVSNKYQPVQPKEVIEFYRDLTEKYGFELETAGSIKDGRRIWALANTKHATQLRGDDKLKSYLLLATSYDGTMATTARLTSVRVVCNNTLTYATETNKNAIVVPHSTTFDANKVKLALNIGEEWEKFGDNANKMSQRIMSKQETMRFFLDVYYGLDSDEKIAEVQGDEAKNKSIEKFLGRMTNALFNSPGANLASARGTLWGALNAVTNDVDFSKPARSQENRLNSAWFGPGEGIKNKAYERALALVA